MKRTLANSTLSGGTPAAYSTTTGSPTITTRSDGKSVVRFTGNGTIQVTRAGYVELVEVGGGGGGGISTYPWGGFRGGGGGGGGAVRDIKRAWLNVGTYAVTIGAGGTQSASTGDPSAQGKPTLLTWLDNPGTDKGACDYTAPGGGAGGGTNYETNVAPSTGASGGGGGTGGGREGAAGLTNLGNAGGASASGSPYYGAGGGGAGGAGGSTSGSSAASGGPGKSTTISGSTETFGAGGGSGGGTNATANTGNGGGGGVGGAGGAGGSGLLMLAFG